MRVAQLNTKKKVDRNFNESNSECNSLRSHPIPSSLGGVRLKKKLMKK